MGLPVIYVAYHNKKEGYLGSIPEEIEGIDNLLMDYNRLIDCKVQFGNSSSQTIFNHLGKFGKDLVIFHYSGHATGQHLNLSEPFTFNQLANVFADRCPKLVFLNGCQTKGFAQRLLDEGVEAVIATSGNISDKDAARFALNFYREFTQIGTSLEVAFKHASAEFTGNPYFGQPVNDGMETDDEPSPYNLYYNVEPGKPDKKPDWELVNLNRADAAKDDEKVRLIYQAISVLKKEATAKEDARNEFDALFKDVQLTAAQLTYRHGNFTDAIQKIEADIDEKERDLEKAEQEQSRTERSASFYNNLLKFNYIDQIPLVQTHFDDEAQKKSCLGAFIVQGSSRCGIEFLRERILGVLKVEKRDRYPKLVIIDSQSLAVSSSSIWAVIKQTLTLKAEVPTENQSAEAVVKAIVDELHNTYLINVHLLIEYRVDYAQAGTVNDFTQRIQQFWGNLINYLPTAYLDDPKSKKLILFVVDKVDLDTNPDSFLELTQREAAFRTAFEPYSPKILALPIIKTVSQDTIKKWRRAQEMADELKYDEFAPEDRNYVLTAIKTICEQTHFHKVYQDHFKQYEPLLPTQ